MVSRLKSLPQFSNVVQNYAYIVYPTSRGRYRVVGLGLICQQLVFAARPEYLSFTYHYISGCPKYKGTTCLHIPTTLHIPPTPAHTYHIGHTYHTCTYLSHHYRKFLKRPKSITGSFYQITLTIVGILDHWQNQHPSEKMQYFRNQSCTEMSCCCCDCNFIPARKTTDLIFFTRFA